MQNYPLHRWTELVDLTPDEGRLLTTLANRPKHFRKGTKIRREDDPVSEIFFLHHGWVSSSIHLLNGMRQMSQIHLAGDVLGAPSMIVEHAAETLTAITDSIVTAVNFVQLRKAFEIAPRLQAIFLMASQAERLDLIESMAALGRLDAKPRMAKFLIDIFSRLDAASSTEGSQFDLPLTQGLIGDLLGLTSVHVNRTLRSMEVSGLIQRDGQRLHILDRDSLFRLSSSRPQRFLRTPGWLPTST